MRILVSRRVRTLGEFKPTKIRTEKRHWLNRVFRCEECGCQFQLQTSDKNKNIFVAKLREIDGGVVGCEDILNYYMPCPECKELVKIVGVSPKEEDYKKVGK